MTKARHTLAGLFTLIAATSGYSQTTDRTTASVSAAKGIGLSFRVSSSEIGKSKFKSANTRYNEASSKEFAFGAAQEVSLGAESALETRLQFNRTALNFEAGKSSALPLPKRLQSIGLGLNYSRAFDPRWSAIVGTSLVSSHAGSGGFKSKGLGVDLLATAIHKSSPNLSFSGGAAFSSLARGTTRFIPVLGMNWTPGPQWTVAIGIPETGVTYRLSESFSLGLVATGQGGAYHVETDPLPGKAGGPDLSRTTLDYFAYGAALKAEWQANQGVGVSASVGRILGREFEYESRNLKLKADGSSLYCELGLRVAF